MNVVENGDKMTNINIEVDDDLYTEFKVLCLRANISVKDKMIDIIKKEVNL